MGVLSECPGNGGVTLGAAGDGVWRGIMVKYEHERVWADLRIGAGLLGSEGCRVRRVDISVGWMFWGS
jgi:hypothetical protein